MSAVQNKPPDCQPSDVALANQTLVSELVDATIEKAMEINDVPVVVDFRVHRDAMVWPMVAAGTSNDEIKYARDLAPDWDRGEEE